jgi:hypothetical protein
MSDESFLSAFHALHVLNKLVTTNSAWGHLCQWLDLCQTRGTFDLCLHSPSKIVSLMSST